jgi:hypothetical protein
VRTKNATHGQNRLKSADFEKRNIACSARPMLTTPLEPHQTSLTHKGPSRPTRSSKGDLGASIGASPSVFYRPLTGSLGASPGAFYRPLTASLGANSQQLPGDFKSPGLVAK